jgi:phage virion morphogenesis protein
MIRLTIGDEQLKAWIAHARRNGRGNAAMMGEISGVLADDTETAFAREADPATGVPWPKLKPTTAAGRAERGHWPGKILQVSGQLAASVVTEHGDDYARIGSNKVYAAIHQLGGTTRPHDIKARNAKALAFAGRLFKKVRHPGSIIPARPWLGISPAGRREIGEIVQSYLSPP